MAPLLAKHFPDQTHSAKVPTFAVESTDAEKEEKSDEEIAKESNAKGKTLWEHGDMVRL